MISAATDRVVGLKDNGINSSPWEISLLRLIPMMAKREIPNCPSTSLSHHLQQSIPRLWNNEKFSQLTCRSVRSKESNFPKWKEKENPFSRADSVFCVLKRMEQCLKFVWETRAFGSNGVLSRIPQNTGIQYKI